jgi:protein-S-isoprenylcysteine O-methyltransferase Ste14
MANPLDKPATLLPPPLVYPTGLLAAWLLNRFIPFGFDAGEAAQPMAWGLVAFGLALAAWTAFTIWRHHTTVNPYKSVSHLVTSGPFMFSRNPIYLGDWLIYIGIALWLGTWWALPAAPVVWWLMRYHVISHEEAHLEAKFGRAYLDYKARVRRWL